MNQYQINNYQINNSLFEANYFLQPTAMNRGCTTRVVLDNYLGIIRSDQTMVRARGVHNWPLGNRARTSKNEHSRSYLFCQAILANRGWDGRINGLKQGYFSYEFEMMDLISLEVSDGLQTLRVCTEVL